MTTTMMVWGDFVFSLPTLVYQDLSRRTDWRYGRNTRLQARAATQFLGPGDDKISLGGYLVPQVAGDASSFRRLRALGDLGLAQPLVAGDGTVFGAYNLASLDERQSHIQANGVSLRVDFQLELEAIDDQDALDVLAKAAAVDPDVEVDDTEKEVYDPEEQALLAETSLA